MPQLAEARKAVAVQSCGAGDSCGQPNQANPNRNGILVLDHVAKTCLLKNLLVDL